MRQVNPEIKSLMINARFQSWLSGLSIATAFIKKDMFIAMSYRLKFVFQILQIFINIAVIYYIGKMLGTAGKSSSLEKYGADYFSFALVGLSINSYLRAGLEGITTDIRQIMNQGTLEAMCASPISYTWLLLCSSLWPFIFETIRVICYFLVAILVFGMKLDDANWPGAILCLMFTAPIFLLLGIISCSILIILKRGDPINWIFSRFSGLLAGTMFPVALFPMWLQIVAFCLPLTHSLEATRRCLLTGATAREVSTNIWALLGFILVLLPLTILVNSLCMRYAKKTGAFMTH